VSRDGAFALVVEAQTDECLAHVWRIPLRGGVAVPFADARHVEPAPNGTHVWIEHVQRTGVNGDECRPSREIERFDGGEVRGPRFTWFPGPDPQSIVATIWSPDGRVLVTSTKQGDIPWLQLWRTDGDTSVMATVGPDPDPSLAGYSVRPRPPHPQLDAIFGANGWGLGNPRFEGDSLVADVVCLGGDRCQSLPRFTVRGGEDGVFDEVNAR
jgi:hypothetical protein